MLINLPADQFTHMPFLLHDTGGYPVLFFCAADPAEPSKWKLHVQRDTAPARRLETGLPADACECSPTAWQDSTGWHVTFIGGGWEADRLFRLYRMDGPTLQSLSSPVAVQAGTRTGHIWRDRLVWAERENLIHVSSTAESFDIELPGAFIYRAAYRADLPERLLISGQWQQDAGEVWTIEYDTTTGEQEVLECDGVPAYKPTIYGDVTLYAEKTGEHFEHRKVRTSTHATRRRVQVGVRRRPGEVAPIVTEPRGKKCCQGVTPGSPAATRASCLECVEKHLGAACVLLTEARDGYAHRLRAVGHLHEAEDESQVWPELHEAIRDARKAYQRDDAMPDWEILAASAADVAESTAPAFVTIGLMAIRISS